MICPSSSSMPRCWRRRFFFTLPITYVVVPYQVFELTHSSLVVGLLGAAQLVPLLVFGLLGGTFADSMDRRRLLVGSEAILAAGSFGLMANALRPHPSVALVFVLSASMSAVNSFHRPALDALTQKLLRPEDMVAAGALNALRYGFAAIAGPALGGVLIAKVGASAGYLVDALTYVVSVLLLRGVPPSPAPARMAKEGWKAIVEGLRYAWSRPELVGTYVVDVVAMTFAFPTALFPALAQPWGGATAAGWLFAAMSIGTVLVTLTSGWAPRVRRHGAAIVLAAAVWGVAIAALAFAPSLATAVVCLAVAGGADTVSGIFRSAIWNETIPNELRGRLSSIEMISYMSGPLLGSTRAGWMAERFSNVVSVGAGGALCVVGVLLCIPLLPGFWKYRSDAIRP